jgi:hypothetical protein
MSPPANPRTNGDERMIALALMPALGTLYYLLAR